MNRRSDLNGASALETLIANSKEKLSYAQLHRFLQRQAHKEGVPLHGSFELTPLCNLDCKMCYVHLSKSQMCGKELLSANQWKRLISEAAELGMMDATLTGGECLTYPEFDEVYLHLQDLGIQTAVLTNGVLLTEERVCFFKEHPVSHIQVTLYGSSEDEYEHVTGQRVFAKVTENLRRAYDAGLPLSIAITPNRFLTDGGEALVRFADELNINYTINMSLFPPNEETGRRHNDIDLPIDAYVRLYTLRRQLHDKQPYPSPTCELPAPAQPKGTVKRELRCSAGISSFSIGWNGVLTPCGALRAINANSLTDGFASAWQIVHSGASDYPIPCECEDCAYNYLCPSCVVLHSADASLGHASPRQCARAKALIVAGLAPPPDIISKIGGIIQ